MDAKQIERHFGGLSEAARALETSRQVVYGWREKGVPDDWQLKAEYVSGGALKASKKAREFGLRIASYLQVAA
jgi:hypothetical protein